MAAEDTEITLGAGKLLGLFFMLAAVCGVFFAVGYSLGKTSAREQALNDRAAEAQAGTAAAGTQGNKPSAVVKSDAETPAANTTNETASKQSEPDLTFYKAVKQNGHAAGPESPVREAKPQSTGGASTTSAATEIKGRETQTSASGMTETRNTAGAPSTTQSLPATSPAGIYLVQIAAVSHEEDAAALAGALRKKSYPAAVVTNPAGKDRLFHVVLGPYASLEDAEAMKLKLQGEGYNPIVKR